MDNAIKNNRPDAVIPPATGIASPFGPSNLLNDSVTQHVTQANSGIRRNFN